MRHYALIVIGKERALGHKCTLADIGDGREGGKICKYMLLFSEYLCFVDLLTLCGEPYFFIILSINNPVCIK